jgi:hypothetical protein
VGRPGHLFVLDGRAGRLNLKQSWNAFEGLDGILGK